MDTAPVVIGSKSRFGRKPETGNKQNGGRPQRAPRKQERMVQVFIGNVFVMTVPLKPLTRFSATAAKVFPKPEKHEEMAKTGGKKSTDDESTTSDLEQITAQVKNLPLITGGESDVKKSVTKSANVGDDNKELALYLDMDGVATYPHSLAVKARLHWMVNNRMRSLSTRVDYYTAALVLNMTPFPYTLRKGLLDALSEPAPTAAVVKYVYEHIPPYDSVLARLITSTVQHDERHEYTDAERSEIHEVVGASKDLTRRFYRIEQLRFGRGDRERAGRQQHAIYEELEAEIGEDAEGPAA